MNYKKWIITFIIFIITAGGIVGLFNVIVDPFGVFGDNFFNWYAYDMTNNPRIAKIAYLDKHYNEYDSYIIGCSKTSSYPTEALDKYYNGAKFYNMMMYGGDMYDVEHTADYIIKNYKVKNIIINIGLEESNAYNKEKDIKNSLHAKVAGTSLLNFYSGYFFQNPQYSFQKLQEYFSRSYLPDQYSVFKPETGVYNKTIRDNEAIGNLNEFIANNTEFNDTLGHSAMKDMDQSVEAISRIKKLCEEKGITFKLIASPVYYKEAALYSKSDLVAYWEKLADVTDFWDFSGYSSISYEPRYFYDIYHFRNSVGTMALAYMFNDQSVYVPDNFGHHTTKDNVAEYSEKRFDPAVSKAANVNDYTSQVPVIMYHNLDPDPGKSDSETVTPAKFEEDLISLSKNGFQTVSYQDILDFVDKGRPLPPKPVIITFDDGYYSNYQYAYPILKKYGMKATISVIGMSVGKDTYKDTSNKIIPHFDYAKAKEMYTSGLIDIQSHSYAMHDDQSLESKNSYRDGVLQKPGESEKDYINALTSDYTKSKNEIEKNVGNNVFVYTYPFGKHSVLSEALLKEMGVRITITTATGVNTVVKGLPQSLYALKRINVSTDISSSSLISMINDYTNK